MDLLTLQCFLENLAKSVTNQDVKNQIEQNNLYVI